MHRKQEKETHQVEPAARQSWLLFLLYEFGLHSGIAAEGGSEYTHVAKLYMQ